jgi:hypothetical protein
MSSLSVKLPLTLDSGTGFTMNKDIVRMIKQNFKMLLLTVPGERVMEPNFGVGIKAYLFSNYQEGIEGQISSRINEQVNTYMPMIKIRDIQFFTSNIDTNTLSMRIIYRIPSIGVQDLIDFTI